MNTWKMTGVLALVALGLAVSPRAVAHCDTLSGPVVADARTALSRGDVSPVLKWVGPADEAPVRAAFEKALKVRGQSESAAELADAYFFETLVRLHRAGEGQPYTGLKAEPPEAVIAAADAALASGDAAHLVDETTARLKAALTERFERVAQARKHADRSVAAGREYVAAYVAYTHFAEQLHQLAEAPAGHEHAH